MNLFDDLARWESLDPHSFLMRDDDRDMTRAEFGRLVRSISVWLDKSYRVSRGERVAYLGLNRVEQLALLYACSHLGATLVVLNWRSTPHELLGVLSDSSPRLLIGDQGLLDSIERTGKLGVDAIDRGSLWPLDADSIEGASIGHGEGQLDDVALIVYTSGTTGTPKGAMLTQRALKANAQNSAHMFDMSADDHILTVLPMFHVGGLNIQTTPALQLGATVTLHGRFQADRWLDDVEQRRPTLSVLVPSMMAAVLEHPRWPSADLSSLRVVGTGSTFVPVPLIEAFHDRGVVVAQVYGATETGPIAVCQTRRQAIEAPGATGNVAPLCALRIVDDHDQEVPLGAAGELWVSGPHVFSGYWNRPHETAEVLTDGWYRTGDVGFVGGDGQVRIADRLKDVIISGGENIYPAALEAVLVECDDIVESAVVGEPHEKWGEVPVAFVVLQVIGIRSESDVLGLFDGRVARYARPHRVVFVDALPRNAMGKVQKAELRGVLGL
jgi:fatty-acyl-CoA synthase